MIFAFLLLALVNAGVDRSNNVLQSIFEDIFGGPFGDAELAQQGKSQEARAKNEQRKQEKEPQPTVDQEQPIEDFVGSLGWERSWNGNSVGRLIDSYLMHLETYSIVGLSAYVAKWTDYQATVLGYKTMRPQTYRSRLLFDDEVVQTVQLPTVEAA